LKSRGEGVEENEYHKKNCYRETIRFFTKGGFRFDRGRALSDRALAISAHESFMSRSILDGLCSQRKRSITH